MANYNNNQFQNNNQYQNSGNQYGQNGQQQKERFNIVNNWHLHVFNGRSTKSGFMLNCGLSGVKKEDGTYAKAMYVTVFVGQYCQVDVPQNFTYDGQDISVDGTFQVSDYISRENEVKPSFTIWGTRISARQRPQQNNGGYQQGGYNNNRPQQNNGGYQQQGGGYNNGPQNGGYRQNGNGQNGGYNNGQNGGYNNNGQNGGYNNGPQNNGGYNNNGQNGGYRQNGNGQQGGYNNNAPQQNNGGYQQQGGYNNNAPQQNNGGYQQQGKPDFSDFDSFAGPDGDGVPF